MRICARWFPSLALGLLAMIFACGACTSSSSGPSLLADGDLEAEAEGPDTEALPQTIDADLDPADLTRPADETTSPEWPQGVRLRVGTFNIYGTKFATAEEIGAFLAAQNLDVVALEEVPSIEARDLIAKAAKLPYAYGDGLVLLSATALSDVREVPLVKGRALEHGLLSKDGLTISVYAAHISWDLDGSRQARQMVDEVLADDPHQALLMMGDFNDETYSGQVTILKEALEDAATRLGIYPGQRISWPSFGFDDTEGSQLIDLVFFRKRLMPLVIDLTIHNLAKLLSDHKPVTAELLFPADGQTPFAQDPNEARREPFAGWPKESARPANLLVNPGAEDGLTGWSDEGGAQSVAERRGQAPHGGQAFFTGFLAPPEANAKLSVLRQTVSLAAQAKAADDGRLRLYLAGYMATERELLTDGTLTCTSPIPYDDAEVTLELLGADDRLLARVVSGRRDTLAWHPFTAIVDAPPGTRQARLSLLSHHKPHNNDSNDGMFDDLYLGAEELTTAHSRKSANLIPEGGAETLSLAGFTAKNFEAKADLSYAGLVVFPPWSYSGKGYYHAGGLIDLTPGATSPASLVATLDLSQVADRLATERLVLHYGAALRTYSGLNTIKVELELINRDGTSWHTLTAGETHAAEWLPYAWRTTLPPGTGAARLIISGDVATQNAAIYADDVFAYIESATNP